MEFAVAHKSLNFPPTWQISDNHSAVGSGSVILSVHQQGTPEENFSLHSQQKHEFADRKGDFPMKMKF